MDQYPVVIIAEKESLPNRIKINSLFQKVKNVLLAGTTKGVVAMKASAAKETLSLVKIDTSEKHRAHYLVANALYNTIIQLLPKKERNTYSKSLVNQTTFLENAIHEEINGTAVTITSAFFDAPKELPIVATTSEIYEQWLIEVLSVTEEKARKIKKQFKKQFFIAIVNEWHSQKEYYTPIQEALKCPFAKIWEKEY